MAYETVKEMERFLNEKFNGEYHAEMQDTGGGTQSLEIFIVTRDRKVWLLDPDDTREYPELWTEHGDPTPWLITSKDHLIHVLRQL